MPVRVGGGQVTGVPSGVDRPGDVAATVVACALGEGVDLVVHGREAEREPGARVGGFVHRSDEQVLDLPSPQVHQGRPAGYRTRSAVENHLNAGTLGANAGHPLSTPSSAQYRSTRRSEKVSTWSAS